MLFLSTRETIQKLISSVLFLEKMCMVHTFFMGNTVIGMSYLEMPQNWLSPQL